MHREQTHTATQRLRRPHCTKYSYILTSNLSNQDSYYTGIKIARPDHTTTGAMDNQGSLTKTGLLYEGNYQEWVDRLLVMLENLGVDSERPDRLGTGVPIITFVRSLVIPRLLLIVPQPTSVMHNSWSQYLLPRLKIAAKPFRLMQLPVDVRTRIWRFAIASQQGPKKYTITADSPFGIKRIHPVTRVSREVRAETLALAWSDVRVEFKPPVGPIRLYTGEQFSSRYARRFHQLDDFERSNRVSRIHPVYASFNIHEKGQTRNRTFLELTISRSLSNKWEILLKESDNATRLAPSTMRGIRTHLDTASRLFSSSYSSTPLIMMVLFGAPSLWEQSNLECEWKPTKPTFTEKPRLADGFDFRSFGDAYMTVLREVIYD